MWNSFRQYKHPVPLTHLSLAFLLWTWANRIAPDVTPQNAASHLGLFCLLREFSSKKLNKILKSLLTPLKMKVDSPQMIMMGKSIRQIWVNLLASVTSGVAPADSSNSIFNNCCMTCSSRAANLDSLNSVKYQSGSLTVGEFLSPSCYSVSCLSVSCRVTICYISTLFNEGHKPIR